MTTHRITRPAPDPDTVVLYRAAGAVSWQVPKPSTPPPPPPPPPPAPGYNLAAAVAGVPFAVSLPAAPTITTEATCTTEAEITASLAVNGRRTIIAPGTYTFTNLTIGGNNKQIVFQAGAVFNLAELQLTSASSVLIESATINATGQYGIRFSASQDVRFTGLTLDADDGGFIMFNTAQVLFVSSTLTAYTHVAYLDENNSHLTIANCNCWGTQPLGGINGWCIRWGSNSVDNSVLMDSRFRAQQNVVLRYEVDQQNGYFARNQIEGDNPFRTEGRDLGTPSAWPLDNLHFIDNDMYALYGGSADVIVTTYPRMTNVTATGNTNYSPTAGASNVGFPSGQTGWTLSGNGHVVHALDDAPPWTMA